VGLRLCPLGSHMVSIRVPVGVGVVECSRIDSVRCVCVPVSAPLCVSAPASSVCLIRLGGCSRRRLKACALPRRGTPLHQAASNGHAAAVDLLLSFLRAPAISRRHARDKWG
jgi:hypothetical protein